MKKFNLRKAAAVLALASAALLTGCGSSPTANTGIGGIGGAVVGPASCVPLTAGMQIPFTATNMLFGQGEAAAGFVPQNPKFPNRPAGTFGQVLLGGTMVQGSVTYAGNRVLVSNGMGSLGGSTIAMSLNVVSPYTVTGTPVSATGVLTLSGPDFQYIAQSMGTASACISGLAVGMAHTNLNGSQHTLYMGSVFVYLNGTTRGIALDF